MDLGIFFLSLLRIPQKSQIFFGHIFLVIWSCFLSFFLSVFRSWKRSAEAAATSWPARPPDSLGENTFSVCLCTGFMVLSFYRDHPHLPPLIRGLECIPQLSAHQQVDVSLTQRRQTKRAYVNAVCENKRWNTFQGRLVFMVGCLIYGIISYLSCFQWTIQTPQN